MGSELTTNSSVQPEQRLVSTRHDMARVTVEAYVADSDINAGWRFVATLRIDVPLRVIKYDGEVSPPDRHPPEYAREMWEGIWVPKTKTFAELGIDLPELPASGERWSDAGMQVDHGAAYLRFARALRPIVETNEPPSVRRNQAFDVLLAPEHAEIVHGLGGAEAAINRLLPPFVLTAPGVGSSLAEKLAAAGLQTPSDLVAAGVTGISTVKGAGPKKAKQIAEFAAQAAYPDDPFADLVKR